MDHSTTATATNNNEMTIDILNAMVQQETASYLTESGVYDHPANAIDGECRKSMIGWCTQVSDFCQFDRITLFMAINALDRYVALDPIVLQDNSSDAFQLAAMACLYTSIKTNENVALDPKSMSKLSKGKFTPTLITDMEFHILKTLGWNVNAPTALSFADLFLQAFLPEQQSLQENVITEEEQTVICQLVQDQIMYALHESAFVGVPASQIALTAVANAVQLTIGRCSSLFPTTSSNTMSATLQLVLLEQAQLSASTCTIPMKSSIVSANTEEEEATSSSSSSSSKNIAITQYQQLSPRSCINMSR